MISQNYTFRLQAVLDVRVSPQLGNILSTPISTALEKHVSGNKDSTLDIGFHVAGGRFEKMIVFTGACFVGAVVVVSMGWGLEVRKRLRGTGLGVEL